MSMKTYQAECSVYFLMSKATGLVKIGFTSDMGKRIAEISSASGEPVSLLRNVDGGRVTEKWLHKRFSQYRVRGEWFRFHPDMLTETPPDEVPQRLSKEVRRDIRLSLNERLSSAEKLGAECGLSAGQVLLTFIGCVSDDEAQSILDALREGTGK